MGGAMRTRIGIIDAHMGGLLPGKAYLFFGETGTGKTLLGLEYALGGIAQGEGAIYVAMERPNDLIAFASGLGADPAQALDAGALVLLEYDRDVTSRILRYGWKPFLDQLRAVETASPVRRIVFDPIHPLFAGNTEEGRLRYDLRYLVETLGEWGWTMLFLNDRGATQGHPSMYRVFSEICAGVFELQDEVENLASSKFLFVHKLRQPSDGIRKIAFEIVPGVGIREPGGDVARPELSVAGAERPKVLVADDDPVIRSLLKKALREHFDVVLAEDGAQALMLTLQERPCVLLLDVMLPNGTGFDVCRSLRSNGFARPILFVSGMTDPQERVQGLSLGANDFISKPFRIPELVQKVRNASAYGTVPAFPKGRQPDLETLLRGARSRSLSPEEFRTQFEAARASAARFGVSMGIVLFQCNGATSTQVDRLLTDLERDTRPEDLVALWGDDEILVALNAEDASGTLAYLRKLRRFWRGETEGGSSGLPAEVSVSYGAISADSEVGFEVLLPSFEAPRSLLSNPLFETPVYGGPRAMAGGASG